MRLSVRRSGRRYQDPILIERAYSRCYPGGSDSSFESENNDSGNQQFNANKMLERMRDLFELMATVCMTMATRSFTCIQCSYVPSWGFIAEKPVIM